MLGAGSSGMSRGGCGGSNGRLGSDWDQRARCATYRRRGRGTVQPRCLPPGRGALLYMGCRNARGGREGWLVAARRGAAGPAVIALTDDGKHGRETIRNHDHMHRLLAPTYSHLTPCAQVEVWR